MTRKTATIFLEYQPYIEHAPVAKEQLYAQACSNDKITIDSWRNTWINQTKANHAIHGPFKDKSIGKLFNSQRHKPIFVIGSGPSLKKNAHLLKDNPGIPVISCLHNFHFLEDLGVNVDYYVSLDAGPLTIDELSEGGDASVDYWEKTKGKKLLCYIGTHPNLLAKWKGEIYFFNAPVPDQQIETEIDAIERFKLYVSSGGNVLGAALYIAKAYLGSSTTIFLGADFSFSYDEKFHGWDSKYDATLGSYIRVNDVYGVPVKTWRSYENFRAWFDWVSLNVPGEYINATEGGCLGAYREGNIRSIKQMDLQDVLKRFSMSEFLRSSVEDPTTNVIQLLF